MDILDKDFPISARCPPCPLAVSRWFQSVCPRWVRFVLYQQQQGRRKKVNLERPINIPEQNRFFLATSEHVVNRNPGTPNSIVLISIVSHTVTI
jgi:hypothetical protein